MEGPKTLTSESAPSPEKSNFFAEGLTPPQQVVERAEEVIIGLISAKEKRDSVYPSDPEQLMMFVTKFSAAIEQKIKELESSDAGWVADVLAVKLKDLKEDFGLE